MVMPRKKNSLQHDLFVHAKLGINSNKTETLYKKACKRFASWAKENGCHDITSVTPELLQAYELSLEENTKNYSPSTIHALLAPVCKATSISMDKIKKPKRTSTSIKKGRLPESNHQGKQQENQERFTRLVTLQRCIGIRRSELRHLTGKDLIENETGMYIHVRRGKGGKEQFQFVLPYDQKTVKSIFSGIKSEQAVFSNDEMNNLINLHGMRAEAARKAYWYYYSQLQSMPSL